MTIKSAELFINVVVVLFTYFFCAPLTGYVRAWAALEMGDDTPEQLGFLTLNPFMHVSRVWLVLIVWLQVWLHYMPFGLGRYIPINPLNIQGAHRGLRLATAYFSDTVAAIALSISAFLALFAMHGQQALGYLRAVTWQSLLTINPETSTLGLVLTWFLLTLFVMASLIAAFGLIINCFHFIYFYFCEDSLRDNEYADMIMLFGPLLLLYLCITIVKDSIMKFVVGVAYLLAYMIGVLS